MKRHCTSPCGNLVDGLPHDCHKEEGGGRYSTSPPSGNQVDGLPLDCHNTETRAKLARLGPAKNDELVKKIGRVRNVLLDTVYED